LNEIHIMKILFFILLLTPSFSLFAQQPTILWNQHFGGTQTDIGISITGDKHGGFIVASISNSTDDDVTCNLSGNNVTFLMKFDSSHSLIWKNCYEGEVNSINLTNDGGYIFTGFSDSALGDVNCNHGAQDFWIVKIDSSGNVQWSKCYGGSSTDIAYSVIQTKDGKYIAAGFTDSNDGDVGHHFGSVFNDNIWIIKLDSSGNLIWSKVIGDSTYAYDADAVMQDSYGNYVVTGSYQTSFNNTSSAFLIKLDTAGNIKGQYSYGGSNGSSTGLAIVESPDHKYVFAGTTTADNGESSGNHGSNDFWLVKADTAGNFIWGHCYGGSNYDVAWAVCNTLNHGFALAGETGSSDGQVTGYHGANDYWIVKTDSGGNLSWQMDLGGSDEDYGKGIFQRSDGNYFITGSSDSHNGDFDTVFSPFEQDIWVTELSEYAGINQLAINNKVRVYPNPTSNQLTINSNQLPITEIQIENVLGQTLMNKIFSNGLQKQVIDVNELTAGIYFYRITDNNLQMVAGKFVKE
jgi:hypothetical protein